MQLKQMHFILFIKNARWGLVNHCIAAVPPSPLLVVAAAVVDVDDGNATIKPINLNWKEPMFVEQNHLFLSPFVKNPHTKRIWTLISYAKVDFICLLIDGSLSVQNFIVHATIYMYKIYFRL